MLGGCGRVRCDIVITCDDVAEWLRAGRGSGRRLHVHSARADMEQAGYVDKEQDIAGMQVCK